VLLELVFGQEARQIGTLALEVVFELSVYVLGLLGLGFILVVVQGLGCTRVELYDTTLKALNTLQITLYLEGRTAARAQYGVDLEKSAQSGGVLEL
jgi:hypothetical protein